MVNVGVRTQVRLSRIVIPNEVRDLHLAGELQIPHFVRDDNIWEVEE